MWRFFLLMLASLAGGAAAWADGERASMAITANGTPVVELFRNADGSLRYQLNDDLTLGMSLGLYPLHRTDHARNGSANSRWLPVFDLFNSADAAGFLLPDLSARTARTGQWFLTVGSNAGSGSDAFDFQADLARHFSLQTKAGFLMPLGRRWLLGGALTLDHAPGAGEDAASLSSPGTSVGAFLGIEFNY